MTPFQEFRLWLRRAPLQERAFAGIAALVAVVLFAWLLVPSGGGEDEVLAGAATAGADAIPGAGTPGGAVDTGAPGSDAAASSVDPAATGTPGAPVGDANAPATNGAGANAGTEPADGGASSSAPPAPGGCTSPPGSAPGLSAEQMRVAVSITSISGAAGNELFGIPSPEDQEKIYSAVIAGVNAEGGIACRQVVPTFFRTNPTDQSDMHQKCLGLAEMDVYANLDSGGFANYLGRAECFARQRIPYVGSFVYGSEEAAASPYLFALAQYDRSYRDTVFALRDRGFFGGSNGFAKLGFLYRDCRKDLVPAMRGWLREAGLSDGQVVPFSVGCPSTFASPTDLQQAVLNFRREGVTHVTTMSFLGDMANFTKIAEQQGFRPKYGLSDDQLIAISYGNLRPDPANMRGAIAITNTRNGEERTPGMAPEPATQRCDGYLRKAGLPVSWERVMGGLACNYVWMLEAAVENAPSVAPSDLAAGLRRAGSIDFSYPSAPTDFARNQTTSGGHFWRAAEYRADCQCWQVTDPQFRPSYQR